MEALGEYIQESQTIRDITLNSSPKYKGISDKGIDILFTYIIGNITLRYLSFSDNKCITELSTNTFKEMAKSTCINHIYTVGTSISESSRNELIKILETPHEEREIPIKSNTKSASKIISNNN